MTKLIQRYGIRGMTNADLRNMIRYHKDDFKLVELCRKQLKFNLMAGRG